MIRGLFEETIQFQPLRRLPAQIAKRTPKCRVRSKVRIGTDSARPSNNPRHFLLFESRRFPFLQHVRNQGPDFGDYVVKTPELLLGRDRPRRKRKGVAGCPGHCYGRFSADPVWPDLFTSSLLRDRLAEAEPPPTLSLTRPPSSAWATAANPRAISRGDR